jgi:thioredoxin 1
MEGEWKMSVQKIDSPQFQDAIGNKVAVVDFNATWCGPCRMLAPVLEALSEEMAGKASFYAMDVDDNPDIAQQFGISSIPYVAVFRDGKKVDEQIGFVPQPQLKAFIERNL